MSLQANEDCQHPSEGLCTCEDVGELQQERQAGNRIAAVRWDAQRLQEEVNRLRRVLHDIADSRPDQHMDVEKTPELVDWICETCRKASVGAYPLSGKETKKCSA